MKRRALPTAAGAGCLTPADGPWTTMTPTDDPPGGRTAFLAVSELDSGLGPTATPTE